MLQPADPGRMRPQILAIANQKGGVGKTTTAINLGTALAALGHPTVLIDMDPQGNASTGLGIDRTSRTRSTYDLLFDSVSVDALLVETGVPNLAIVPATADLASADIQLMSDGHRLRRLRTVLETTPPRCRYVLIDCPPALNLLTINALVAADHVLVPLQSEFFALEGLSQLVTTVREIRRAHNSRLAIMGIALTMYDRRNNLSGQVERDVRETFGHLVFDTVIPRNVRLSEAPSHAMPAILYDRTSPGSLAYQRLAAEVLGRIADPVPA